jgi:hypothetical protein
MKRYEYAIKKIVKDVDIELNRMGKLGWLLITIKEQLYYFLRETKGGE